MDDGLLDPAYIVSDTEVLLREYLKIRNAQPSDDEWEVDSPIVKSDKPNISTCQEVGRNLARMGNEFNEKYQENTNCVLGEYEPSLNEYDNFKKAAMKLLSKIQEPGLQLIAVFEICHRYTSTHPPLTDGSIQHALNTFVILSLQVVTGNQKEIK
ncbi:uncharacterized protein LOC115219866 isoform X2 [Octopus sinensis]|uniref:Uncharacterized protein LOC115219866 isoform X2 n=1 Tax=Octopus sinensis TaxID=2607531 RepID=A0A6P7T5G9_9MOLL|nr:uncharacterized protein LOC115219866 isoform X2 [Octopus sinensis]XP_029646023.1 uncharacterized protein LOC115219866 isoform X2 [Octopus sinensis]XP_029646024.1 uncharacterized protein LOC115219866 isoform X2 [Octopus sinensis]XP_036365698.1 uncharacterized protein LOC115219866 isoform X2 [Octopus sinensis]